MPLQDDPARERGRGTGRRVVRGLERQRPAPRVETKRGRAGHGFHDRIPPTGTSGKKPAERRRPWSLPAMASCSPSAAATHLGRRPPEASRLISLMPPVEARFDPPEHAGSSSPDGRIRCVVLSGTLRKSGGFPRRTAGPNQSAPRYSPVPRSAGRKPGCK